MGSTRTTYSSGFRGGERRCLLPRFGARFRSVVPPRRSGPDQSKLAGEFPAPDWAGACLGYWPSYDQLTPEGRAAYLSWLSWQRSAPNFPIGYVFLYFYGLERRALIDGSMSPVAQQERLWILGEVERLLTIYGPENRLVL